ncbi:hypothetical protein MTR_0048s0130 [Medicago truncatula]|uniref:Uncharacterized protein n=1 Tax=Medicago truncatula TaxID=3880 RepID=A0A072TIM2_MEDTR|nr:hypothetical protein MTR_0048s0130 [Medicago truncatula]
MFRVKFYMVLSALSCIEMVRQVLESYLGIGKSKLGFWGEKWVFPESCTVTDLLFHVLASFSHVSVLNWPLV